MPSLIVNNFIRCPGGTPFYATFASSYRSSSSALFMCANNFCSSARESSPTAKRSRKNTCEWEKKIQTRELPCRHFCALMFCRVMSGKGGLSTGIPEHLSDSTSLPEHLSYRPASETMIPCEAATASAPLRSKCVHGLELHALLCHPRSSESTEVQVGPWSRTTPLA